MHSGASEQAACAEGAIEPLHYEVAYADTDAGGIVYHATYIAMAERSRNHALRMIGLPVAEMTTRYGVLCVIREIRAVYHRPAFVGDALMLSSGIVSVSPVRALWRTTILRGADPVCDVEAQLAAFDAASAGACLLPEELIDLLGQVPGLPPVRRAPIMKMEPREARPRGF